MSDPVKFFYDELVADSVVTSKVSSYKGAPAVFSAERIPEDAELPYIWIQIPSDTSFDTKDRPGRDVFADLGCYVEDLGSVKLVDELAAAVRDVFRRRSPFSIGEGSVLCLWAGTIPAPTAEGILGRIVSIRLVWTEPPDVD